MVAGSLVSAPLVTAIRRQARASSNRGRSEEASPYRRLPELENAVLYGPVVRCPDCDAIVLKCTRCGGVRTDVYSLETHCEDPRADRVGVWSETKEVCYLNFTHGTSDRRLCSPKRRVRTGFLWRKRCDSEGLHVHQKCERCGWHGTARIASAHREAPRLLPAEQNDLGSKQFVDHE
jgi:hypothetical protein